MPWGDSLLVGVCSGWEGLGGSGVRRLRCGGASVTWQTVVVVVVVVTVAGVVEEPNSRREQGRGWIMWMPPMGMSRLWVGAER